MRYSKWAALLALGFAVATTPAYAADQGSDFWLSLGGGFYDGEDYDPPPGQAESDAETAKGGEALLALNFAGPVLARLRATWMIDYTSNTAEDVGALIGLPLGTSRRAYLAAGVSRLTDVSNRKQAPIVGVPVELLFYLTRGLEVGVHGNFNSDSDFAGITIAGVFGKRRAQ
jgi:hypothetical protein